MAGRLGGTKVLHIAVIGTGQLGGRHLQGLCRIPVLCALYMVDPLQSSVDRALHRLKEVSGSSRVHDVLACTDVTELPERLDLAILATTSEVRLPVLERLLAHSKVKHLILEKVLFTREAEYQRTEQLLQSGEITAWVNCPRRMYDIYRQVREFFTDKALQHMQVHGGGWGLGCNGIHFADLLNYLTGVVIEDYDTRLLDPGIYPSKREGFVEFSGTLIGRAGSTQLWLTDTNGGNARHIITLRGEDRSCLIDEVAGRAWFLDEQEGWHSLSFSFPPQSQLTGDVAMTILQKGVSALPGYRTSAAVHLPFIRSLTRHYVDTTDSTAVACPIT